MNTFDSLVSDAKNAMDAHDGEALAALFAPDGRVTDENTEHVGRPAIAQWFRTTPAIRLETVDTTVDGNAYTLIAKGHGDYPNSPLTFRYVFALGNAGISSLSISLADEAA
ncbi:nuclear transport factor 2 family protein [Demequina sp. SO4-13]|uniref:nuclear transport factor 2 family protein n=1 Tax=Demequina sp. SO4-13 TaxID=3401027 RepID=UPI003AF7041F